jgi:hypothetical protein
MNPQTIGQFIKWVSALTDEQRHTIDLLIRTFLAKGDVGMIAIGKACEIYRKMVEEFGEM